MKCHIMNIVWLDKFKIHKLKLILINLLIFKFILIIKIRHL